MSIKSRIQSGIEPGSFGSALANVQRLESSTAEAPAALNTGEIPGNKPRSEPAPMFHGGGSTPIPGGQSFARGMPNAQTSRAMGFGALGGGGGVKSSKPSSPLSPKQFGGGEEAGAAEVGAEAGGFAEAGGVAAAGAEAGGLAELAPLLLL